MAGSKRLEVQIVGDAKGLQRTFGNASDSAGKWGRSMAKAGKFAAIGLGAGLAAIGFGAKKAVDAAEDAEKAQGRLDRAFKQTGASAKERAAAMATVNKVSQRAALDDEDLSDSLGRLVRVTGDVTKAQRDLAIAADLARGRGIELEAATKIVEKAELGQLGALKRIGIEIPKVTAAQDALKASGEKYTVEQMKAAKATDDLATRQTAIAALQRQYAGDAEAYGNKASSASEKFAVATENLQEALGAKLLPVFARVAIWATNHLPVAFAAVESAMDRIGPVFSQIVQAAERAWPRVKAAALAVVDWYRTNLQPTIEAVIDRLKQVWDKFGDDVLRVVRADLAVLRDAMNAILAAIRGDWDAAWRSLLPTARGTLRAAAAMITLQQKVFAAAARALGDAVIDGMKAGLAALGEAVTAKLRAAPAAIRNFIGSVYSAAIAIGRALTDGVVDGIGDIGGRIYGAAAGGLKSAVSRLKGLAEIRSPSALMAREVGKPLGEGVGVGFASGMMEAIPRATASIQAFLDRMKARLGAARDKLAAAFGALGDRLFRAFDAETSGHMTPAEAKIAEITKARRDADLQKALEDARAGGDTDAIARAEEAITLARLEEQAAIERKAYEDRRAEMRVSLEKRLAALTEHFQKEGATVKVAMAAINKLMRRYGITFEEAGAFIGEAFMRGLQNAAGAAAATAPGVKKAQQLPETVQVVVDRRVLAEVVRNENGRYVQANGAI